MVQFNFFHFTAVANSHVIALQLKLGTPKAHFLQTKCGAGNLRCVLYLTRMR